MDVSRVSMVTPKVIDWRKLTAKDIIKYDSEGMNVPSEYLSWAKSFRVDLEKNDTDETTYEMAVSKPDIVPVAGANQATSDTNNIQSDNENATTEQISVTGEVQAATVQGAVENPQATDEGEVVQEGEETSETGETGENPEEIPEEEMTSAQRLQKMEEEGENIVNIGKTFRDLSDTKTETSDNTSGTITSLGQSSDNAIASLDSYMSDLLSQVSDVESKINDLVDKPDKRQSDFAKILQLEGELNNLGISGQNVTIGYDTDLNMYQTSIDEGVPIGLDAQDYGNTTVELGKEIKRFIFHSSLGRIIENAGKDAVSAGGNVQDTSTIVSGTNKANLNTIGQYQDEIKNRTGVSTEEVSGDNRNSEQNQNAGITPSNGQSNNTAGTEKTGETNTAAKAETSPADAMGNKPETATQKAAKAEDNTSDARKTDVEKKEEKIASGNLDEILKRKMRKGEVV